jgi:LysR family hydrogen peroxide-inducible transcriptional activator
MEIHQLRYFLAVAQVRNFSRAAEKCHVAQPSLSQQILKLEDELGEKLFERTRGRVALTPAGEIFRQHAERVVDELELARDGIRAVRGLLRGRVLLGVLPTVAPYFLPKALRGFGERHAGIEIVVHEDTTANLVGAVETKELDLALVSLPVAGRLLRDVRLFEEELCLALPRGHALARKKSIELKDLADEPFILMKEGHCLAGQSLQFCQAKGFSPRVSFRSAQIDTVQAFVAAGLGVSLVPAMARRQEKDANAPVVYRSLANARPTRNIGLIHHRQRALSRAAQAFIKFLREEERSNPEVS